MIKLKWIYKWVIHSGLNNSQDYQQRRGVLLTNNIALMWCAVILSLYFISYVPFWDISEMLSIYDVLEGLLIFFLVIVMNRLSWINASRIFLILGSMGLVWQVHLVYMVNLKLVETSLYDSLLIYLLASSSLPFLLFEKRKWPIVAIFVIIMLLSIWCFDDILGMFQVNHARKGNLGIDYPLMKMRVLFSYLIIGCGSFLFQLIIYENDSVNQNILREIKVKTDEIEAYNEELSRAQEKLNEINQNLEGLVADKTKDLVDKNTKLLDYAHINAHYVRAPLARLLGLLQVSSMEKSIDYPWYLQKIEEEILEIDMVLKGISEEMTIEKP